MHQTDHIRIFFWVLAVSLLMAGPFVGLGAKHLAQKNEQAKAQLTFEDHLNKQVFLLENKIDVFIEVLAGLRSFFESSSIVTRAEFASFTRHSLVRHPTIQALEWIPKVAAESRTVHEEFIQIPGKTPYRITTKSSSGKLIPAPEKSVYFPVCYLEPLEGNLPALGFDLNSESTRQRAIIAALSNPDAVLSDPVDLVQANDQTTGILMFMRVDLHPSPGQPARKTACQGLVLLVLNLDEVIESTLLSDAFLDRTSYAFELVDIDVQGKPAVLYAHPGISKAATDFSYTIQLPIETGQQVWRLTAHPQTPFLARHAGISPTHLGLGATAAWELIWISLIALANWSRSSALHRQNSILDSVLLSMAEGVVVADAEGRVILANHAAALHLGFDEEMRNNGLPVLSAHCRLPDKTTPYPFDDFPLAQAINGTQVRDKIFWVPPPNPTANGCWLSANAAPLLDAKGKFHGGVLVMRDITHRKQSLEFSERMNEAVEQTDDAVMITDRNGIIQYVNSAFQKTTGFTRGEVLGQIPNILKSELNGPDFFKDLWETILRGEVFRNMIINRKKSGEIYYADQTITPMRDLSGKITHFVAVTKDMTEYRLKRQREVEMEIAVKVQQRLFPSEPPPVEGLDIAGAVLSADATCGDYYDFIPMSGNRVCLTVGDVSGHGIGPAMIMAETRAYIRSLSPNTHSPGQILSKVNRNLISDLDENQFVTLIMACIDTEKRQLVYCSAGHDTCFILDRTGKVKHELKSSGLPVGLLDRGDYQTSRNIAFTQGDLLFLMTDGLADCLAHQDRFLDIATCLSWVQQYRHEPASVIIEKVHEKVREIMAGEVLNDDITIIICKVDS